MNKNERKDYTNLHTSVLSSLTSCFTKLFFPYISNPLILTAIVIYATA